MRFSQEGYQMQQQFTQRLPGIRPAHELGGALWVYGAVLAKRACQSAVVHALEDLIPAGTARQRVREWLTDGRDNARSSHGQVEVTRSFSLLLRWVIS